jgi:hydrogenase nickel incorporation protein HypB
MCTSCGCASGNVKIEGQQPSYEHGHSHERGHSHEHDSHSHEHGSHSHDHEHGHSHAHQQASAPATIIHHHYHGTTHIHYHGLGQSQAQESVVPAITLNSTDIMQSNSNIEETTPFNAIKQGDDWHYGAGAAHSHAPGMTQARMVQIEQDILGKNNQFADKNRQYFTGQNIKTLNLVSSPGSGKTTLLTRTLALLQNNGLDNEKTRDIAVIEGDQQTANDAERIRATGVRAIQINTGKGCHLDAQMVGEAAARLSLAKDGLLIIENVGNLVCPASFDLGEQAKVAILSVTEGADKPLKYPDMFHAASLMIINKIDLLPYVDFDVQACIANAKRVNPNISIIELSAKTNDGMQAWLDYLAQ